MDDDTASIKKGGRTPLFSSMAVNAFRRRELSLGLSPTSNPALSSLLETQKRDEAARNKSQTHLQTPVPPPTPFPAPAPTIAPTPAAPVPARPQPQARSRTRSQTPPRSRTPPRRDISADGYHSGTGSDSEGEPKSVRERRSLAMRLGRLAKSNSLTRVFGLNRKRRTSETSIDQHVSRTSSRATTPKSAEWPAGPIMVDSPPAIVTPPLEPVAPAAAPAAQPQVIPIPAPELEPVQALVQALVQAVEEAPVPAPAPVPPTTFSASPVTCLPFPMADSDTSTIKRGGRGAFFSSMAVNALRRRSSSSSASLDRSTSNPALSSLLETQKRDEAARSKAQAQAQPSTPVPTPASAQLPGLTPSASPVQTQPQPQPQRGSQTSRSRTPPRRDISADGYGTDSDSDGETESMKERRWVAKRLGGLAKSNNLTRVLGLNRKRRTSDASVDTVSPPEPVSRDATSEFVTQTSPVEQVAGPIIVDSPPAIATPPPKPAAPAAARAPESVQLQATPIPAPASIPPPEPDTPTPSCTLHTILIPKLAKLGDVALDVADLGHDIEFETVSDGVKGGQGDVYRAFLGPRRTLIAVKVLRASGVQGLTEVDTLAKRLGREMRIWKALEHKHITPFLGFAILSIGTCLISPWCGKGNAEEYLKACPGADRHSLVLQVADGLIYLHNHKIIHGDIKARNVLINDDGEAMLCDFGLAKFFGDVSSGFTTTTEQKGTTRWMAPEQFVSDASVYTYKSDVYAFGCLVLEMMTGKIPFIKCSRDATVILLKCQGKFMEPVDYPELPASDPLWPLLRECWAMEPEERPSMDDIHRKLSEPRGPSI